MMTRLVILTLIMAFLAFLIIFIGSKKNDDKKLFSMLWAKYLTTLLVITVVIIPLVSGDIPFLFSVLALAALSQNEVLRLSVAGLGLRIAAITAGTMALLAGFAWGIEGLTAGLVFSTALLLCFHCFLPGQGVSWTIYQQVMMCLVYPTFFWGFYLLSYHLPRGPELLIFFYCVTEMNNAFAQLAGSMAGKTKAFPKISPNKTWEGILGGAAAGLVAGLVINSIVFKFSLGTAAAGTLLIIFGATAGDLIASGIKRSCHIKDFGQVLPNHGGVIDIFDSIIFTSPFFYFFAVHSLLGQLR